MQNEQFYNFSKVQMQRELERQSNQAKLKYRFLINGKKRMQQEDEKAVHLNSTTQVNSCSNLSPAPKNPYQYAQLKATSERQNEASLAYTDEK